MIELFKKENDIAIILMVLMLVISIVFIYSYFINPNYFTPTQQPIIRFNENLDNNNCVEARAGVTIPNDFEQYNRTHYCKNLEVTSI